MIQVIIEFMRFQCGSCPHTESATITFDLPDDQPRTVNELATTWGVNPDNQNQVDKVCGSCEAPGYMIYCWTPKVDDLPDADALADMSLTRGHEIIIRGAGRPGLFTLEVHEKVGNIIRPVANIE